MHRFITLKYSLSLVLCLLVTTPALAQKSTLQTIDSLEKCLGQQQKLDTLQLAKMAWLEYRYIGYAPDKSGRYLKRLIKGAHQLNYNKGILDGLSITMQLAHRNHQYEKALQTALQARNFAHKVGIARHEAAALMFSAQIYNTVLSAHDKAIALCKEAEKLLLPPEGLSHPERIPHKTALIKLYNDLGTFYMEKKDFKQAIINLRKALPILLMESMDIRGMLEPTLKANLADTYLQLGDYVKAELIIDQALKLSENTKSTFALSLLYRLKSDVLREKGQLIEAEKALLLSGKALNDFGSGLIDLKNLEESRYKLALKKEDYEAV